MLSCTFPPSGSVNKAKSRRRPPFITRTPETPETTDTTSCPQQLQFARSKSCGEGRASKPYIIGETNVKPKTLATAASSGSSRAVNKRQGFTCGGALCIYLPTFTRATKADKTSSTQNEVNQNQATKTQNEDQNYEGLFSRRISMAKFEWGSRSSAAIICKDDKDSYIDFTDDDEQDEDSVNLYFDLPLELMRYSENDSPEKAAFIFKGYQSHEKTFDKINSSDPLLSCSANDSSTDVSQQVRFSLE